MSTEITPRCIKYLSSLPPLEAAVAGALLCGWALEPSIIALARAVPEPRKSWINMVANARLLDRELLRLVVYDMHYEMDRMLEAPDG